jgi:hypothetical protein
MAVKFFANKSGVIVATISNCENNVISPAAKMCKKNRIFVLNVVTIVSKMNYYLYFELLEK